MIATILLVLSGLANVALVGMLIFALMAAGMGSGRGLQERVVAQGAGWHEAKIAVIHVNGLIDEDLLGYCEAQIQCAAEDDRVKAVILRVNSPGGGLTASDTLHHLLTTRLENKPIVAAMDSVAASGGYYVSCAAQTIVAQPTTVTGSIGVIGQMFFVRDLMKDKLGVTPVTIKVGSQKDWPNPFSTSDLPPEQRTYILNTLMVPGYERFVRLVKDSRGLDEAHVRRLATGRVFTGPEALDEGLVDEVGYFDCAVQIARQMIGSPGATVVEYQRVARLADLVSLQNDAREALSLTPERLAAQATPRIMYLWTGQ